MVGYLLVTEKSLPEFKELIAADYWRSVVKMEKINKLKKKNYSCCVICLDCNLLFRYKLSWQTGIPLKRIITVKKTKKETASQQARTIINADSFMDDTFLGKIKSYDPKIPKEDFKYLEIKYAEDLKR